MKKSCAPAGHQGCWKQWLPLPAPTGPPPPVASWGPGAHFPPGSPLQQGQPTTDTPSRSHADSSPLLTLGKPPTEYRSLWAENGGMERENDQEPPPGYFKLCCIHLAHSARRAPSTTAKSQLPSGFCHSCGKMKQDNTLAESAEATGGHGMGRCLECRQCPRAEQRPSHTPGSAATMEPCP